MPLSTRENLGYDLTLTVTLQDMKLVSDEIQLCGYKPNHTLLSQCSVQPSVLQCRAKATE